MGQVALSTLVRRVEAWARKIPLLPSHPAVRWRMRGGGELWVCDGERKTVLENLEFTDLSPSSFDVGICPSSEAAADNVCPFFPGFSRESALGVHVVDAEQVRVPSRRKTQH